MILKVIKVNLTFNKVKLLDASRASIPWNQFNVLYNLRQDFGQKGVELKDKKFEQLFRGENACILYIQRENTHDCLRVKQRKKMKTTDQLKLGNFLSELWWWMPEAQWYL